MALELKAPQDWRIFNDIIVSLTSHGEVEDQVWDEYLSILETGQIKPILSLSADDIAGMSAVHRKRAAEAIKMHSFRTIVVMDSRATRGILTAVSWLGAKIHAFSWHNIELAIEQTSPDPDVKKNLTEIALQFRDITAKR